MTEPNQYSEETKEMIFQLLREVIFNPNATADEIESAKFTIADSLCLNPVPGEMKHERWKLLMASDDEPLTEDERLAGWHFCVDWDGLLVGPGMEMELEHCTCSRPYP